MTTIKIMGRADKEAVVTNETSAIKKNFALCPEIIGMML